MKKCLPIEINGLIPHRPPMLAVGQVVHLERDGAVTRTVFQADSPFAAPDGQLEESLLFEMMAQTFAAAVAAQGDGPGPSSGYLAGVKKMKISGRAKVGRPVEIEIKIISEVDDFSVIEGRAGQDGKTLAAGQLTIFVPER